MCMCLPLTLARHICQVSVTGIRQRFSRAGSTAVSSVVPETVNSLNGGLYIHVFVLNKCVCISVCIQEFA